MSRIASTVPPEGAIIPERHPKAPPVGSKIPSHFGHCFGCGELHPTGLHLVAYAGSGTEGSKRLIKTLSWLIYGLISKSGSTKARISGLLAMWSKYSLGALLRK